MKKLNDSQKELLNGALDNVRPEYLAEASVSAHDGQTRHTAGAEARKAVLRWVCVAAAALLIVGAMVFASLRGDWLRQRFGGAGTGNPGGLPTPSGDTPWRDTLDILDCGGEYAAYRLVLEGGVPYLSDAGSAYSYTLDENGIIQDELRVTVRDGFVHVEYPFEGTVSTRTADYQMSRAQETQDRIVPVGTTEAGAPMAPSFAEKEFRCYKCSYGEIYVTPDALYFQMGPHWGTVELRQIKAYPRADTGTERSVNPPVPVPSSALPTGDEAKALQDFCAPKYDSKDTRHVDVFLEILARDGNKQSDGTFDKSYNYQHAPFYNATPESIRSEVSDLEFFYNGHCLFMLFDGVVYKYSYWQPEQLCLWDYDGDGILELVSYGTIGSGIVRLDVTVLDLETMKSRPVYSSMLPYRYSFLFYNGIIYLDGYSVTYEDGEFRIDPAASRVIPEYAAEYTKQTES